MVALVYLREHTTLAKVAAGFRISESTAHAYTSTVIGLLADRAPGLLKVLRETDPDFVLLDGTLAECETASVTDGPAPPTSTAGTEGTSRSSPIPRAGCCGSRPLFRAVLTT